MVDANGSECLLIAFIMVLFVLCWGEPDVLDKLLAAYVECKPSNKE